MTAQRQYRLAKYTRLSREDGDRLESDSIVNQRHVLDDYCARRPEFQVVGEYTDDGYTGTNFDRPAFRRMIADIEAGKVDCVIVKDLSRFGRDYIDMGYYLERYFPAHGVRFIAIGDGVDSKNGPYDMLLPLKNVFNTQYAKDISGKVKSAFKAKQRRGEFIGAFASYGYQKDPEDSSRLLIDPPAARVVQRVYRLFEAGLGKISIARRLNGEGVPCPSAYKRLMGLKYDNGQRLPATSYWTYATVDRMLRNPMYTGDMVQARSVRLGMHAKAKAVPKEEWIVVRDTHPAIIPREQWDRAQKLLARRGRAPDFGQNVSVFAGFLKCGDCGRAMVKTVRKENGQVRVTYSCGSHKRYGADVCSPHTVRHEVLEDILLGDLNHLIASVKDLGALAEAAAPPAEQAGERAADKLRLALERLSRLKRGSYEDYKDGLLTREEYITFRGDYEEQEQALNCQLAGLERGEAREAARYSLWVEELLATGRLEGLDRQTLAETVEEIRIFEDRRVEIDYLFSEEAAPPCAIQHHPGATRTPSSSLTSWRNTT